MPGRVNTKFVIILSVVLVGIVGAVVGVRSLGTGTDPAEHKARGDALFERGEFKKALDYYGRALHKGGDDGELWLRYAQTLDQIEFKASRTAQKRVKQQLQAWVGAVRQSPDNPQAFGGLMRFLASLAREMGDTNAWDRMVERSQNTLNLYPNMIEARKYRGIGNTERMVLIDVPSDIRQQTLEDLEAASEADPGNDELVYYKALWHMYQARALRSEGRSASEIESVRDKAEMITGEALAAQPSNVDRRLNHARILLLNDKKQAAATTLRQIGEIDEIARKDPNFVLNWAGLISVTDQEPVPAEGALPATTQGVRTAEAILRAAMEEHPREMRIAVSLGRNLAMQKRVAEAIELFEKVRTADIRGSALEVVRADALRNQATLNEVDLLLTLAQGQSEPERSETFERASELLDHLRRSAGGETTPHLLLSGKLALQQDNPAEAVMRLDRAIKQLEEPSPELLLLSAQARLQTNETGAARKRLEEVIAQRPDYLPARYELARFHLRFTTLDKAKEQIDRILSIAPNDEVGLTLKADWLAKQDRYDEAIALFVNDLNADSDPRLSVPLARLYQMADQPQKARELLEAQLAENPQNLRLIVELLRVVDDPEQRQVYVAQAKAAGAGEAAIEVLDKMISNPESLGEVIERQIIETGDENPLMRHIRLFQLYRQQGKTEQAMEQLEKAEQINPDHPFIIEYRFVEALSNRNWREAEQIVSRARAGNADHADGFFYSGRLDMARNLFARAEDNFRKGTIRRPIYAEGWRRLGDSQRALRKFEDAKISYDRALEDRPNNVGALRGKAAVLEIQGEHDEALKLMRRAFSYAPNDQLTRLAYLRFEEQFGDTSEALKIREELATTSPRDFQNRRDLALLQVQLGETTEAMETVDALLDEQGATRENLRVAADVRRQIDGPGEASEQFRQGILDKGVDASAADWMAFGEFLLEIGRESEAFSAFRQAQQKEDERARPASRRLAEIYFDLGRFSDAAREYKALWQQSQTDELMGQRLTESLVRSGQTEAAEVALQSVIDTHGRDDDTTLLIESLVARAQGDKQRALAALRRASELNDRRALIHYELARLLASEDQKEAAIAELNKALDKAPSLIPAREMLVMLLRHVRPKEAGSHLRLLVDKSPKYLQGRVALGRHLLEQEQWIQLEELVRESEQMFPENPTWNLLRAEAYKRQDQDARALKSLAQAFELAPSPAVLAQWATLLVEIDRPSQALQLLQDHIDLVSGNPMLQSVRARTLAELNRTTEASQLFLQTLSLARNDSQVLAIVAEMNRALGPELTRERLVQLKGLENSPILQLATAQIELKVRDYAAAVDRLESIETKVPSGSGMHLLVLQHLATGYYQLRQYDQTEKVYRKLLTHRGEDPRTLNNLAFLLAEDLKRPAEAIPLARKASQLSPGDAQILDTLGRVQFLAGQVDDAYETLNLSVRIQPLAANKLHLAEVFIRRDNRRRAIQLLKEARELAEEEQDSSILERAEKWLRDLGER